MRGGFFFLVLSGLVKSSTWDTEVCSKKRRHFGQTFFGAEGLRLDYFCCLSPFSKFSSGPTVLFLNLVLPDQLGLKLQSHPVVPDLTLPDSSLSRTIF